MDIVEFLRARLDEDEQSAKDAMQHPEDVEPTVSVPQPSDAKWRGYNPDRSPMLVHAPASDVGVGQGVPDPIGDWGWTGGPPPVLSAEEQSVLDGISGTRERDEDEPWKVTDSGLWDETDPVGAQFVRAIVPLRAGPGTVRFIALHNPARVLREVEAKRRIVDRIESRRLRSNITTTLIETLIDLASAYADHPDYDPEWTVG